MCMCVCGWWRHSLAKCASACIGSMKHSETVVPRSAPCNLIHSLLCDRTKRRLKDSSQIERQQPSASNCEFSLSLSLYLSTSCFSSCIFALVLSPHICIIFITCIFLTLTSFDADCFFKLHLPVPVFVHDRSPLLL